VVAEGVDQLALVHLRAALDADLGGAFASFTWGPWSLAIVASCSCFAVCVGRFSIPLLGGGQTRTIVISMLRTG